MPAEKTYSPTNGYVMLLLGIVLVALATWVLVSNTNPENSPLIWLGVILYLAAAISLAGLFIVNPNDAAVLTLFGTYVGTVKANGFAWANPFFLKRKVTLRARNLNGERLKVNDKTGNPVEIAAVVVWQVEDAYKASFDVDDYENYVVVQSEAAVRHLTNSYPYDNFEAPSDVEPLTLRAGGEQVNEMLENELGDRFARAGVRVIEARISHLAYAPEIAQAMLRRQQASAVVSARAQIVNGAVGMVEMALERLAASKIVELDEERKAAMVSNLLVVLCSETQATPVVNAGTLYQ